MTRTLARAGLVVGVTLTLLGDLAAAGGSFEALVSRYLAERDAYLAAVAKRQPTDIELAGIARTLEELAALNDPQADQYLLLRLEKEYGDLEVEVVRALLIQPKRENMKGIYDRVENISGPSFLLFCLRVPVAHLDDIPLERHLSIFGRSHQRRHAIMTFYSRVQSVEATKLVLECAYEEEDDAKLEGWTLAGNADALAVALARVRDRNCVGFLCEAVISTRAYRVRTAIARALGEIGLEESARYLAKALESKNRILARTAARSLGEVRNPEVAPILARAIRGRRGDPEFVVAAIPALTLLDPQLAEPIALEQSRSSEWRLRAVATHALAAIPTEAAFRRLLELLGDSHWQIRTTAFDAIEKRPRKEVVEALIEHLGKQTGAVHGRAWQLLITLTGEDCGSDPEQWKRWWARAEKGFEIGNTARPSRRTRVPSRRSTRARFFGLDVDHDRIVFLLDVSGSMEWKTRISTGRTSHADVRKILLAKKELVGALEDLAEDQRFNVTVFASSYRSLFSELAPSREKTRRIARKYVAVLDAEGPTNLFDPLEQLVGRGDVDGIYILSDGAPNRGRFVDPERIVREVKNLNIIGQVTIHGIALGYDSPLLEALAEATGGEYKRVGRPIPRE